MQMSVRKKLFRSTEADKKINIFCNTKWSLQLGAIAQVCLKDAFLLFLLLSVTGNQAETESTVDSRNAQTVDTQTVDT
jgi:hypothetical protein